MGERGSREEMEAVCGRCEQYVEDVSSREEEVAVWGRCGNIGEGVWGRWRQYVEDGCSMAEMWQYGGDEGIWGRMAIWGR